MGKVRTIFGEEIEFPDFAGDSVKKKFSAHVQKAWEAGVFDESDEFCEAYFWYANDIEKSLLKKHPGQKAGAIISSIQDCTDCVTLSVRRLLEIRHELIENHDHSSHLHQDNNIVNLNATREFFNFITLSKALVDLYRKYKSAAPALSPAIDASVKENFENYEDTKTINEIRNLYSHGGFLRLHWTVSFEFGGDKNTIGTFSVNSADIDDNKAITRIGLERIKALSSRDVFAIAREYEKRCRYVLEVATAAHVTGGDPSTRNYYVLSKKMDAISKVVQANAFFQNHLGKDGIRVYEYVTRIFSKEEADAIICQPPYSPSAANLAMSMFDKGNVHGDDHIKKLTHTFIHGRRYT
jgi:hypothetical protein